MENDKIEIQFRLSYLIFLLLCGIMFVVTGVYMIIMSFNEKPDPLENWFLSNPVVIMSTGILCIIFFGFCTLIIIRKISGKNPGLVINNTGIIDNSTGFSPNYIKWENIKSFKRYNFLIVQFIAIIVDNNDVVIKRVKNKLIQIMAKMDTKMVGSPYNIYINMLKCKPKVLFNILQEELKNRKMNSTVITPAP